ncbi:MAG: hypothetical protein E6151_00685 [Dialister micraerophilus]|nr:hypothetical protein [Dialister micraerophilus]
MKIAPSLLSADFANLEKEVRESLINVVKAVKEIRDEFKGNI